MAYIRLHIQQADGNLPMVCMRCGEPAAVVKTKKMAWFPRWVYWLLVIHLFIFVIVAMVVTKRARLQAPLCEQHQGHWIFRRAFIGLSLLALIGCIAGSIVFTMNAPHQQADFFGPLAIVGNIFLGIGWLITLIIMQNTAIRAADITKTHILLAGVSEAFVQAVEEAEIERRVRLRQWEAEDAESSPRRLRSSQDIEEDYSRRPGLPPDAFKE